MNNTHKIRAISNLKCMQIWKFSHEDHLGEGIGIMRELIDYLNWVNSGRDGAVPNGAPHVRRNAQENENAEDEKNEED